MSLVALTAAPPSPEIERELRAVIEGDVRFDAVSRALYSTDASVYQIAPLGVVIARTRQDVVETARLCARHRVPLTMRGGGTSQAGQAIGPGIVLDVSKHLNRLIEVNPGERWARVEPGIVLDELNARLREHGLRFAPDISTASRATLGGMIANNSAGARSVLYGKTIDHVLELTVLLADGSVAEFRELSAEEWAAAGEGGTLAAACYRAVTRLAREHAEEIDRRYPKVLRRVGGYNLDEFARGSRNLSKLIVGSEGTLGVVLEAKVRLVPLPRAKAVLAVQFADLLEALEATPAILTHSPSAVEVMDGFILSHTRQSAALDAMRNTFIEGDPGALLCIEFYGDRPEELPPRIDALAADLRARGYGYRYHRAVDLSEQAKIWSLREAALGLSMAMKDDAKSLSFVEDTAVAPEKLRDYIARFLEIVRRHETTAGVYAHASVGCLHVRPVVNLKTEAGVAKFAAIATEISDLVLEFGGALSGEHGDGLVRSPFMAKMFGPRLYEAFRTIKRTFDPLGILNPGKIVDAPALTANLRYGAGYVTPQPETFFDYSDYGGMGGAVEMCSGLGACRKTLEGMMCPSYMATRDEADSTRGRANVLRLAMAGRLGEAGLGDEGVYRVMDLCLECRACKSECPVGVDMARFKSEFLADYWKRHGAPRPARLLANVHTYSRRASAAPALANWLARNRIARKAAEALFGIDRRRSLPELAPRSFDRRAPKRDQDLADVLLFVDTFTNFYDPEIGEAAWRILEAGGRKPGIAPNTCCGRPLISKGFLGEAREAARENARRLYAYAKQNKPIVFLEPSCLSAVREDAPSLLRGEERAQALAVAQAARLFEELAAELPLAIPAGQRRVLLHGHCHQKSMGLQGAAKTLLARAASVTDPDAGCCGMAGSFGYTSDHYDVSRRIGERRLFPAIRARAPETVIIASGVSCRHQIRDFTGETAVHPAVYLNSLLRGGS
jgi:FAD/FMN-containing dehydrogenase/Fe-S oxidoreductase